MDKRNEDGFVYYGYRTVRKGGKIKVDNKWYQHDKLNDFIGLPIFIYDLGSYWETEYTCYHYSFPFKKDWIICTLK